MKQRSIPVCIILSLVTCGIYGFYWFITLTEEINSTANRPGETSGGICFLLTLVTCGIYGIYWGYKMGEKVDAIRAERGVATGNLPILYLVLNLFGLLIVTEALIQSELNQVLPA